MVKSFNGRVAAITGAGSGIGRALASELARRGCHLSLADIDGTGLEETVKACEGQAVKVHATTLDVADRESVHRWADVVVEEHGQVNLVVNNAGVALGSDVESMSYEDFEWLMSINFWGVVYGSKAFLPHLKASGDGHLVNMSSIFGMVSVPLQSAYNSAKFAVRGFTDALRMELEVGGAPVSCTTVHPGGVKTNIARNGRFGSGNPWFAGDDDPAVAFDRMAMTTPERAAQRILDAVQRNRRRVVVGADAHVLDVLGRLPAGLYQRIVVATTRAAVRASRR